MSTRNNNRDEMIAAIVKNGNSAAIVSFMKSSTTNLTQGQVSVLISVANNVAAQDTSSSGVG